MAILQGVTTRTTGGVTHTRAGSVTHTGQPVLQPGRKGSLDVPSSSSTAYVGGYSTSYGSVTGTTGYGGSAVAPASTAADYLQHGRLPSTGESFRLPLSSATIVGASPVGIGRVSSIMANRGGSHHTSTASHYTSTGAATLNSYQLRMATSTSSNQQGFGSATMPAGSFGTPGQGGYAGQYDTPTTAQVRLLLYWFYHNKQKQKCTLQHRDIC
jgi:hypothetical protein